MWRVPLGRDDRDYGPIQEGECFEHWEQSLFYRFQANDLVQTMSMRISRSSGAKYWVTAANPSFKKTVGGWSLSQRQTYSQPTAAELGG